VPLVERSGALDRRGRKPTASDAPARPRIGLSPCMLAVWGAWNQALRAIPPHFAGRTATDAIAEARMFQRPGWPLRGLRCRSLDRAKRLFRQNGTRYGPRTAADSAGPRASGRRPVPAGVRHPRIDPGTSGNNGRRPRHGPQTAQTRQGGAVGGVTGRPIRPSTRDSPGGAASDPHRRTASTPPKSAQTRAEPEVFSGVRPPLRNAPPPEDREGGAGLRFVARERARWRDWTFTMPELAASLGR